MWKGKKVSLIFPTYNEKDSIHQAITQSFATGLIDEVIVVNNNAKAGTAEEVSQTPAIQVFEQQQGYGYAIRRGLAEVTGDLIIISEPDGTFNEVDYLKLLVYHDDGFEVVLGTRTTKGFIWDGANMGWLLKTGNVIVAKFVEILFFSHCQLTDVGCTLRLITREALQRIHQEFSVGGSHFGLEFLLLVLHNQLHYTEIPIHYLPRVGVSSVTGSRRKTVVLALRMLAFLTTFRIKTIVRGELRMPKSAKSLKKDRL